MQIALQTILLCIENVTIKAHFVRNSEHFVPKSRQICSPKEQFHQSPINPNYRITALSYYRINYTTKLTQSQIS